MSKTVIIIIAAILLIGLAVKFVKGIAKAILILIALSFSLPYVLPYVTTLLQQR